MLQTTSFEPCTRCGKVRIAIKTWREKTDSGVLIFTQTVCPDSECQKIVDGLLKTEKKKRDDYKTESVAKLMERNKRIQDARIAKSNLKSRK